MEAEVRRMASKANTNQVKWGVFCEANLAPAAKGMGGSVSNECLTALAQGCEGHKKAPTCEKAAARREALKQIAAACRLKWR